MWSTNKYGLISRDQWPNYGIFVLHLHSSYVVFQFKRKFGINHYYSVPYTNFLKRIFSLKYSQEIECVINDISCKYEGQVQQLWYQRNENRQSKSSRLPLCSFYSFIFVYLVSLVYTFFIHSFYLLFNFDATTIGKIRIKETDGKKSEKLRREPSI